MPELPPRWTRRGRELALAGLLAGGCGDEASPPDATAPSGARVTAEEGVAGDPLLRRAREGIRAGELPPAERAEVLGSAAPEHARARRVLLAMVEPPPGVGDERGDAAAGRIDDAGDRPPPILPPADPGAVPEPVEPAQGDRTGGTGSPGGSEAASNSPASERPVRAPKARADLGGLSLKATSRGATLTIAAPSSLVVGVANQPASGIVRLVIESAEARSAVLHARPSTEGAAVTGVRQGQGTVQITIRLEPGWSLGSVQPFSGGAKVHLVAPP